MPESLDGLAVTLIALLPGALYTWGFERLVGKWGVTLSDRLLRFVGGSAVFHAVLAPVSYWLWSRFVLTGRLGEGKPLPLLLWLVPLLYVGMPLGVGSLAAWGHQRGTSWSRVLTGSDPAPRAWDYLFQGHPDGWVRCRLKSGIWVGGAFASASGRASYVAGYPEPADIYLAQAANVDPDTGEFMLDSTGGPALRESGLLLRWEEVEYLEFIDA